MLQQGYTAKLPGAFPEQLAALPAVWLLLPGADQPPQPAGALLVRVQLPPAILPAEAQQVLLHTRKGLQPALRLAVYCRYTGQLLQWRDWLERDESALYAHPRHPVPAWDSRWVWLSWLGPRLRCIRCLQLVCAGQAD